MAARRTNATTNTAAEKAAARAPKDEAPTTEATQLEEATPEADIVTTIDGDIALNDSPVVTAKPASTGDTIAALIDSLELGADVTIDTVKNVEIISTGIIRVFTKDRAVRTRRFDADEVFSRTEEDA